MSIAAEHEIVTIPRADALQVYTTPGAIDPYLGKIKTEVDGFLALGMTVETDKGRKAIRSMAFRMARTRAALENIGKALADEVKAIPKKVTRPAAWFATPRSVGGRCPPSAHQMGRYREGARGRSRA